MQPLVLQRGHGAGADLAALFLAEQEGQFMFAQVAADRLATTQQGTDGLLGLGIADPAPHGATLSPNRIRLTKGTWNSWRRLSSTAMTTSSRLPASSRSRISRRVLSNSRSLSRATSISCDRRWRISMLRSRSSELALDQRHAVTTLVRNTLFDQQLVVLAEEGRVGAQVGDHRLGIELGGLLGTTLG